MWCVILADKNKKVLDTVCYGEKPTQKDMDSLLDEIQTFPELTHLVKAVKNVKIVEVPDVNYDDLMKNFQK